MQVNMKTPKQREHVITRLLLDLSLSKHGKKEMKEWCMIQYYL